ncbi:MAG: hypothetical protein ABJE66_03190 [Deltaproteobacteria bacterium]
MGDSSDKNDKTQMLSDSQVLEVKPSAPKLPVELPVKADDKNDRSVWKGLVVGADDFAPPAPTKSSGGRWVVIGILAAAAFGAGAYVVWPKGNAPAAQVDAAAQPAIATLRDAMPQDAAAADAPSVIEDAATAPATETAVPEDAAPVAPDAGVKVIKRKPPPKRMIKRKHP